MLRSLVILGGLGLLGACDASDDGYGGPDAASAERRKSNATFYVATPDLRLCASPMCGGWWVSEVNHATTVCMDGTSAASCYVAGVDFGPAGLTAGGQTAADDALNNGTVLMKAHFVAYPDPNYTLADLAVTQAWAGGTGHAASGGYARERENGLACLTYPCEHLDEGILNRMRTGVISDLDFTPSGATSQQQQDAIAATLTPDGLIVAGRTYVDSGPGGTATARKVTEYYTRLK
jgi:hypothetical protein